MHPKYLVTPFFFDQYDAALVEAVEKEASFQTNFPGYLRDRTPTSLARVHQPIKNFTIQAVSQKQLPVSIAGDCAASLPVMAGQQSTGLDPALVWLDAHGDFNTLETSPSGFLGGMPLAMMVGRGDMAIARNIGLRPLFENDVWLIGARDMDPLEKTALAESDINRCELDNLAELRIDRPVHLHIDNDILDASVVPANNYPVPHGPDLALTIHACVEFTKQNQLTAISFSGWNGQLDKTGSTARVCAQLLSAIIKAQR